MGVCITGCGKAQPGLVVENESLEKIVDTSDEWIFSRTGIKERRVSVNETGVDLAEAACAKALGLESPSFPDNVSVDSAGKCYKKFSPQDIDLIVMTTVTPDTLVPSEAAALKKRIGATNAIAFDINAACTGFIYGIGVAESMMAASNSGEPGFMRMKPIKRALVVSSERLSRLTNWLDRNTCVLFGDGAGAMVIEWSDDENDALSIYLKNTDDEANSLTCIQSYSSPLPFDVSGETFDRNVLSTNGEDDQGDALEKAFQAMGENSPDPARENIMDYLDISADDDRYAPSQCIRMNGQKVFKFASKAMEEAVRQAAELAGISIDDIDLVVPHQANYRIIEYAAKRLGMSLDRFQLSIEHTGNSSSSCLPMALVDAICDGKIGKGSIVCLVAFGGGLTSGAAIMRF